MQSFHAAVCGLLAIGSVPCPGFAQSGPLVETARYYGSQATADDFANSVAISGDIFVMGVPHETVGGILDSGAVYVFERSGAGWTGGTELARLTVATPQQGHWFGTSVAIQGDTIVAGAPSSFGNRSGEVFVFEKPAGGWTDMNETAALTASDGASADNLGFSVALDGVFVLAGAHGATVNGAALQGAAYLFERPSGGWSNGSELAKFTNAAGAAQQWFGWSVALDGETAVVGAPRVGLEGAAFVFERPATGWVSASETATIAASDASTWAVFGQSVDVDGSTIVVGANRTPLLTAGVGPGAVYVFEEPVGGWTSGTEVAKLSVQGATVADGLGTAVSLDAGTLVASAPRSQFGLCAGDSGAVYLFSEPVGGWVSGIETARFVDPTGRGGFAQVAAVDRGVVVASGDAGTHPATSQAAAHVFAPPYELPAAPSLDGVSPSPASSCGTTFVGLTGFGLQCVTSLTVGGITVPIVSQSATGLVFKVPDGHPLGAQAVVVTSQFGTSNAVTLTIEVGQPVLQSLSNPVFTSQQVWMQSTSLTIYGTDMLCAIGASLSGSPLQLGNQLPDRLTVFLPPDLPIGDYDVEVTGPLGPSNALTLSVVGRHPSVLSAPTNHRIGVTSPYRVWTDAGWSVLYLLSGAAGATALPGIVSFEIGGGLFGNLVPVITTQANSAGFSELPVTMPVGFPTPFTLYWECMTFDPAVPLGLQVPLETSNPQTVSTPF